MQYQYVACNESGEMVKGKIHSSSEDAVADMMGFAGYRLINLKPYVPFLSTDKLMAQLFPVKHQEVIMMFRQLALLLESGINIVTSLGLLQEQMSNRTLKKVMGNIIDDLKSGNQLSMALGRHPQIFPAMACRSLSIGEQTGGMETMLRQVADYMERDEVTKKSIKGALTYPLITMVVAIAVVLVLMIFVLPAFTSLYSDLGAELPAITQIMMDASDFLRANILYLLAGMAMIAGAIIAYIKSENGRYVFDKLLLKIPLMGRVLQLNELSRACRSISLLYTAGLPLTEIMPLVVQGADNKVIAEALDDVRNDMLKGNGLAKPMAKNPIFLPMMVQMVKVGEETGSLDTSVLAVAKNFEAEGQDKTKSLIALIPVIMTIIIAGMVGLIAISMVSAMYGMYGQAL